MAILITKAANAGYWKHTEIVVVMVGMWVCVLYTQKCYQRVHYKWIHYKWFGQNTNIVHYTRRVLSSFFSALLKMKALFSMLITYSASYLWSRKEEGERVKDYKRPCQLNMSPLKMFSQIIILPIFYCPEQCRMVTISTAWESGKGYIFSWAYCCPAQNEILLVRK